MPPATKFIVDIETRLDTELSARLGYKRNGDAMPPPIYHLPCAIAIGRVTSEGVLIGVESLGSALLSDDPCELTKDFWYVVNRAPFLITFNGRVFDIPVMELCGLRYRCVASKHWGEKYGSRYRYGQVHMDLLDILSNYGVATKGLKLDHLSEMLGYRGKDGMDGSMVQAYWDAGKLEEIRSYNRRDIMLTYALWLNLMFVSGQLTQELYLEACTASKEFLDQIL